MNCITNIYKTWIRYGFIFYATNNILKTLLRFESSNIMPKPGFYAVKVGRVPGIYMTWSECEAQVKGFPNAVFKKLPTSTQAEEFVGESASSRIAKNSNNKRVVEIFSVGDTNEKVAGIKKSKLNSSSRSSISSLERAFENDSDFWEQTLVTAASDVISSPLNIIYPSSRKKNCFYAVHRGRKPGVYRTWTECEAQIKDVKNASYRKFESEEEALNYVKTGGIVKANKRELKDIRYNNHVVKRRKVSADDMYNYMLANPDEPVVIFTDGASSENGKRRARAGIGVYWGPGHPLNTSKRLTGRQTNNRAEIHAAIHALKQAKQIGAKKVKLYTDSQFLIHSITDWIKKWKKNRWTLVTGEEVTNKDDFIELDAVQNDLDVEWIYVKAHARHHGNEEADKLAVAGAKLLLEPPPDIKKWHIESENTEKQSFIVTGNAPETVIPLVLPNVPEEKKPFYAVHRGKCPGVYSTWTQCEQQVKDFPNPVFRKFFDKEEATEFVISGKIIKKELKIPECKQDEFVTVFTDGASSCNGTDEAAAGIGVYWGPGNPLNTSMRLPGRQTNNRAEIHAAVHALKQAKKVGIKNVRLYTDSQFVIKGITSWIDKWKKNEWKLSNGKHVINKDDFIALDEACQKLNVDWCYIKGHDNNPGNVEADRLAVAGSKKELSETIILA